MNQVALYALQVLQALPQILQLGGDVAEMIRSSNAAIERMVAENREPTDEEWASLNAHTEALRKELHG